VVDRCVFFDDLLARPRGRLRSYELIASPAEALTCLDVQLRDGDDWYFARKWVRTPVGSRELFRTIDRLDAAGFRFRVAMGDRRRPTSNDVEKFRQEFDEPMHALALLSGLSPEERRLHRDLFPEEAALLDAGYDWDWEHVYKDGQPLPRDAFGRVLERADGILYEWARVADEFSWRRYPLERIREVITSSGT
jgi:hypothetical protein